jgi:PRTRC genetic system protein E
MEKATTTPKTSRIIDFERIRQLIPEKGSIQFVLKMDSERMRVMFVRKGAAKSDKNVTTLTLTATPEELNEGFDEKIMELNDTKYKTLDQVFKEQAAAADKKIEDAKKKPATTSITAKKTPPAEASKQPVKVIEHKKTTASCDLFSDAAQTAQKPSEGTPVPATATMQEQENNETECVENEASDGEETVGTDVEEAEDQAA